MDPRRCHPFRRWNRVAGRKPIRTLVTVAPTRRAATVQSVDERSRTSDVTVRRRAAAAARMVISSIAVAVPARYRSPGRAASPEFLRVRIDNVTPNLVTTTSEPTVTVTGTVTNTGDRPVRDVVAALTCPRPYRRRRDCEPSLRQTTSYQPVGDFRRISPEIVRGQRSGSRSPIPMRAPGPAPRNRSAWGVPLLVNVNGTDYGEVARLDDARFFCRSSAYLPRPHRHIGW